MSVWWGRDASQVSDAITRVTLSSEDCDRCITPGGAQTLATGPKDIYTDVYKGKDDDKDEDNDKYYDQDNDRRMTLGEKPNTCNWAKYFSWRAKQ